MGRRSFLPLLAVLATVWCFPSPALSQTADYQWTFGSNGSSDYSLTSVSSTVLFAGSLPAFDPTINLTVGKRYRAVNLDPTFHPLEIIGKASSFTNDAVLLGQGSLPGTFEANAGVNWQDEPSGAVSFTLTQPLVDAMRAGGNAPGYRCGVHVDTMRGDFNVQAAPTTPTLQSNRADFVALLNGEQDGTNSTAVGTGRFFINTGANQLTYEIRYGGLSAAETASHIHGAADVGQPATVKHPLPLGEVKNGVWNYPESDEADILAGRMYVNVHSTNFPGGEIRGQIVNLVAQIDGAQDGTTSTATGTGFFIINTSSNQLSYHIRYSPLVATETASHIHGAAVHSVPASVLHPLPATNPKVGAWNYPEDREDDILSGRTYVNIHSTFKPAGEIRGQITRFVTTLEGEQDRTTSTAVGTGMFSLHTTDTLLGFYLRYSGLSAPETAAHFHGPARVGQNAGVLQPLPAGSPKLGAWDYTTTQGVHILSNRTYVNVHTSNFPAGEIRGQVFIINGPLDNPIPDRIPKGDIRIELQRVGRSFAAPIGILDYGDPRVMFVYDQAGTISICVLGAIRHEPLLSVKDRLTTLGIAGPGTFDERGLIGFTLHPNYVSNGKMYTYTSERVAGPADFTTDIPATGTMNCQSVIAEWTVTSPTAGWQVDPNSRREILRVDKPQFNHNAGTMRFGPDGFLYIAFGDGGGADDQNGQLSGGIPIFGHGDTGNGQNINRILGKIIRIDVDARTSPNGRYGIPPGNPFVGRDGLDEIFAYGFRNPFMFSFDKQTGELYVGDVGQNDIEEVDIVTTGGNYGWHVKEGSFPFDPDGFGGGSGFVTSIPPGPIPAGLIEPIAEYDHDDGLSVIGGFVYRGNAIPELRGKYVTGDFGRSFTSPTGRLFYLDEQRRFREFRIGAADRPLGLWLKGFGQDSAGELYVCGSTQIGPFGNTGVIHRIIPVPTFLSADRKWVLYE